MIADFSHAMKSTKVEGESDPEMMTGTEIKRYSSVTLDYYIAGFPKCGTTSLVKAMSNHNETMTPTGSEDCILIRGDKTDSEMYEELMDELIPLAPIDSKVKRIIKCPQGAGALVNVQTLQKLFPHTKLIFGLRHPVLWFQSFYNYRVKNHYRGKRIAGLTIPSVESLLNGTWTSLSVEGARFELSLKNLGKTNSTFAQTPFQVFLYTIDQMRDADQDRRDRFRQGISAFLDLEEPLEPIPHMNVNELATTFEDTIDICDSKHDKVRNILVDNGKETQRWLLEEFLESPDVSVANEDHFRETVKTFGSDPCVGSTL